MRAYALMQARLVAVAGGLVAAAALLSLLQGRPHWALGFLAGGAVSVAGFLMLGRQLARTLSGPGVTRWGLSPGYVARLLLTTVVLALLFLVVELPLVPLVAGTLSVQAVILGAGMGAALEETLTGRPGRLRLLLGCDGYAGLDRDA